MGDIGQHAPLAPSGAYRWAPDDGCRGAAQMERRFPEDQESEAAREGTAAHWWVSETLSGRDPGSTAPNGETLTQEMATAGRMMVDDVRRLSALHKVPLHVERRIAITTVHKDCWGTPDACLINPETGAIIIWDYKYGHRYVDPWRNWQLILYAIGVLETEGYADAWRWRIDVRIVQPRNYHPTGHIRTWYLSGMALRDDYIPKLRKAADQASVPGAALRTGDHCRDCSARHACPALARSAMLGVDIAHEQTPMALTPPALGLELRYLKDAEKRIKARCDALEEQALGMMRAGKDVPLWRADYSGGRECWAKPVEEVLALGNMFGVSLAKAADAITPKQARDAGVPEAVVKGFTETPRGSLRLMPVTDDTVARAFEN